MLIWCNSGSGKSTLLSVLAHRKPAANLSVTGNIYIDNTRVQPQRFRINSAYMEQDDALIGSLTVRETLDFTARLSLPTSVGRDERRQRVEKLLRVFGIYDKADDLVGSPEKKGISGGQRRRLSIAAQLITEPKVLLLDEPTSGLDSAAAFEVVAFLQKAADMYKVKPSICCRKHTGTLTKDVADHHRVHAPTGDFHVHDVRQIALAFARADSIQW